MNGTLRRLGAPLVLAPVLTALALIALDRCLPVGIRLNPVYDLPVLWLAWLGQRRAAWTLMLTSPALHIALRFVGERPRVGGLMLINWAIFLTTTAVALELVYRGRWYFNALTAAAEKPPPADPPT